MSFPTRPETMNPPEEPEYRGPRNLILCFDGTGNQFESDKNSNVVQLFQMLARNRPERQLVYYQTGIGTYTPIGFWSSIGAWFSRALDEAFAWYLQDHVMGGYKFLMETYRTGDKIYLFGFSRGAYTARALAGMLYRVGLLPKCNFELVPFAYNIYRKGNKEIAAAKKDPTCRKGWLSRSFRETFSREVSIEFLGIWDTVSSIGFIPRNLPNTAKNPIVKNVRHALSLDERRARFKANPWGVPKLNPEREADPLFRGFKTAERTVEEVWFAGGHGDVGGGWEVNSANLAQLSNIPLRWIVREAKECTDISWDEEWLKRFKVERPTTEEELKEYVEQERQDALSKYHSAFKWSPLWIGMELLPLMGVNKFLDNEWKDSLPHFWQAREIRHPTNDYPTRVHSSVLTRRELLKEVTGETYENRAKWHDQLFEYVDDWALPEDVIVRQPQLRGALVAAPFPKDPFRDPRN